MKSYNRDSEKNLLISRLNQWAVKHSLLDDPYLISLLRDIEKNNSLDFWATLDPSTRLPRPISKMGDQFIRWAKTLAIARNVLVFVPVAITWKAIAEATAAFSEFIKNNSAAPVNFLQFWQDGYGVLDPIYRIGTIAEVDFWIIVLVIATSLFSTSLLNIGRAKDSKEQIFLDSEQELIAIEILKFLTVPTQVKKGFTNQDLHFAMRNLVNATESIASAAKRFEAIVDRANTQTQEARTVTKEAKEFQASIIKAFKRENKLSR